MACVAARRVSGSASATRHVTVYRPAAASFYGPGLYGGALACGGTLQPGTLGVAHKWLPCGTRVRLRYRGRSVTVPVIDRGPYVGGRDFDPRHAPLIPVIDCTNEICRCDYLPKLEDGQ